MALTATDLFNDATTREIGGIGPDQVNLIVSDLIGVQQMLQAAVPTINNLSDLHTQVIINGLIVKAVMRSLYAASHSRLLVVLSNFAT